MTIITRKSVRDQLAQDLETVHGSNVWAVFPYMATKFEGRSPVVRVMNGGSYRPRVAGISRPTGGSAFRYVVQHFVRYDEAQDEADQAAAEDALDALEQTFSSFMSDTDQVPGLWKSIEQIDYSEPALVKIGSFQYLLEAFLIEAKING